MNRFVKKVNSLKNGSRLAISATVAILIACALGTINQPAVHWMAIWLAFSTTHLSFSWITILSCGPNDIKRVAEKQDAGRATLTFFLLLVASASLVAVLLLYTSGAGSNTRNVVIHVLMTLLSVATAWFMLHTTLAFKYAHQFYRDEDEKGICFPKEDAPGYMEFIYFSFVIGTTFQVSDVEITTTQVRKTVWMHSLLSFAFNTIILALSINIVSGMIEK